jgi:hypothetical protein
MLKNHHFIIGLALLLVSTILYADASSVANEECKVTNPLNAKQWQLIGIPCNPPANANTVEAIFADDINGSYGNDWILYGYNTANHSYEKIGLQDVLEVGKGYWIFTHSDTTQLDLPDGSQPASLTNSTQCAGSACFEKAIVSNGTNQFQLVANPFHHSFSWSDLRGKVATTGNSCTGSEGCTLAEMQSAGIMNEQGWHFDGSAYVSLNKAEVPAWTGFWVAALDSASSDDAPTLLFPSSSKPGKGFFNLNFGTSPLGEYDSADVERDWPGMIWAQPYNRVNVIEEDGNRFLRVNYPQGGVGPKESGAQWKVDFKEAFGTTYDELYVSYKVRFVNGFDPVYGGKLPGMLGGEGNTGGKQADGYDGWSARMMWGKKAATVFYVYHADMPGKFGDVFNWGEVETKTFPAGEWVQVEHRIVINSPGEKNGVLQGWYNGVLMVDKNDMRYRHVDSFTIDGFFFSTFFGGSSSMFAPTRNETIDFDDFIFSAEPISH